MMKKLSVISLPVLVMLFLISCTPTANDKKQSTTVAQTPTESKKVVYQVFTRLFGNTNTTNKAWGTKQENGVGKFNINTPNKLNNIKDLRITNNWYTRKPHHAFVGDNNKYGSTNDESEVVRGRGGSSCAVRDYYNDNPDLATDPANRLEVFK